MADKNHNNCVTGGEELYSSVILLHIVFSMLNEFVKKRLQRRKRRVERLSMLSRKRIAKYLSQRTRAFQYKLNSMVFQLTKPQTISRQIWCKSRSQTWWDLIVEKSFTSVDWVKNFRMSKQTFNFLCRELHPFLCKEDTNLRKAISVRKRGAIALWRLATNTDYRTIGHLFGVSKASAASIVDEFCNIVKHHLLPEYVRIPSGKELDSIINQFTSKWGFPQCAGAIDGSHIPVKAPIDFHADYYNRKGSYSIILQALVDSNYQFIDINIGWPGRVHDARVFANSSLFMKGSVGNLFPSSKCKVLNGVNVPVTIISDAAYPLLPWVMKPFADNGNLSPQKLHFNYRHSRARMVVENAFGRLKGRWRCLLTQNEVQLDKMNSVVATCCVLHNICEKFKENFHNELIVREALADNTSIGETQELSVGRSEDIRDAIVQYCQDNDI